MYNHRTVMADIYANRRARLRQLIEDRFDNNQSALARRAGYSSSTYLSALLKAILPMGERTAWKIEAKLGLPDGWMDRKPPPGAMPNTHYKARIGRPPQKPYDVHAVEELLAAGYAQREIARQLGVHESTISRIARQGRAVKREHKLKRPQGVAV